MVTITKMYIKRKYYHGFCPSCHCCFVCTEDDITTNCGFLFCPAGCNHVIREQNLKEISSQQYKEEISQPTKYVEY